MSKSHLACFVKTPDLSPVKTRLAADIGTEEATRFYHRSVDAVRQLFDSLNQETTCTWAVAESDGLAHPLWVGYPVLSQGVGGLGDRLAWVHQQQRKLAGLTLMIGSDAPQVSAELIRQTVQVLSVSDVVFGRAADGGFWIVGSRISIPDSVWKSVIYSDSATMRSLVDAIIGWKPAVTIDTDSLPVLTDVDTLVDLQILPSEMKHWNPALLHEWKEDLISWIGD
ncbi:MAG: DUF2064 domain-containing protein [Bacteroidetes bacterium]|nr:DUF2064 domain-containing protein [Bacteroidota bacterium]